MHPLCTPSRVPLFGHFSKLVLPSTGRVRKRLEDESSHATVAGTQQNASELMTPRSSIPRPKHDFDDNRSRAQTHPTFFYALLFFVLETNTTRTRKMTALTDAYSSRFTLTWRGSTGRKRLAQKMWPLSRGCSSRDASIYPDYSIATKKQQRFMAIFPSVYEQQLASAQQAVRCIGRDPSRASLCFWLLY